MAGNLTAMIASIFSGGVSTDPYFNLTTLLLSTTATNGQQNNTFQDSSTNNFTITRNPATGPNAPTQGTFSPFSQTGWGNYFNTNQSIYTSNAAFAVGTGNFTVELFYNPLAWAGTNQRIFVIGQSGTDGVTIQRSSGSNVVEINITASGSTNVISYTWNPTIGQWYHIALVRSGTGTNQTALYIDGVSVATGTSTASIGSTQLSIGGINWVANYGTQGYISNVRYSNIARTITVPTAPYTADANTLLLTCQSNRFVDNSPTPKTFTIQNAPTVVPFSPFNPTSAWSASTVGGSGYFDGTGDYLSGSTNLWATNTSTFTVDGWVYPTSVPSAKNMLLGDFSPTGAALYVGVYINSSRQLVLEWYDGATKSCTSTSTINLNEWSYVAVRASSNAISMYVNSATASGLTGTTTLTNRSGTTNWALGQYASANNWNGYVSNIRMSTIARTISIPTTPFTSDIDTKLLLNFTNFGIYDATAKNVLETVGTAQASTTQAKFGTTSMYFDGVTTPADYLIPPLSPYTRIGASDYTLEMWLRPGNVTNLQALLSFGSGSFRIFLNSSNIWFLNGGGSIVQYNSVVTTANQWYYLVLVRKGSSGTNCAIFLDGTRLSTGFANTTDFNTGTPQIAAESGGSLYQGYMQDFRLTRFARYDPANSTITVPTAAFPVQ